MAIRRNINIGTLLYTSGQKVSMTLPRDGVLLSLNVRLQYTVTNGATPAVGPLFQSLARLIRTLEINMGGRDTPVSMSGEMLSALAYLEAGTQPKGMTDTVVLTGNAVTVYDVVIPIKRYLPRSTNPYKCADDLRNVSQATLTVTWGNSNGSDLYTTPNAAVISAVTCKVEAEYLMDVAANQPFMTRQLSEISVPVTATNTALPQIIDGVTGILLRGVNIAALADGVGNASILNGYSISSSSYVFDDRDAVTVQGQNKTEFQLENLITGYYANPFPKFGDPAMMINTSPGSITADVIGKFNVTKQGTTCNLLLGVEAVRPPKY